MPFCRFRRLTGGKISAQGNALGSWFPTTAVALSGRNNNADVYPRQDVTGAGAIFGSLSRSLDKINLPK
ncbi:MAG TPA: hypothetical protein VGM05_05120 [Planctomycetaceae bacterium]